MRHLCDLVYVWVSYAVDTDKTELSVLDPEGKSGLTLLPVKDGDQLKD